MPPGGPVHTTERDEGTHHNSETVATATREYTMGINESKPAERTGEHTWGAGRRRRTTAAWRTYEVKCTHTSKSQGHA